MENQISRRRLLIALGALPLVGACGGSSSDPVVNHYIRAGASGTKDGSSWANAWPTFASVTWTRGDTYFVAGGTYTENVTINVNLSGSLWVYIKKANATDNGGDAGWSSSYASDVASINGRMTLQKGYVSIDGVTGERESGHGIRLYCPTATGDNTWVLELDSIVGYFNLSHLNIEGPGFVGPYQSDAIYFPSFIATVKNVHIATCWLHEVTRNGFLCSNANGTSFTDYGLLFENSVVSETGACTNLYSHGQGFNLGNGGTVNYVLIRNNIFRNIAGSSMIAFMDDTDNSIHTNIQIHNNVFYVNDPIRCDTISPGVIWQQEADAGTTGSVTSDWIISNNTFYGIGDGTVANRPRVVNQFTGSTNISLINNLWEGNHFTIEHDGIDIQSNNGYYGNTGTVPSGTTNQVNGSASAFTNAPAGDFSLASGSYAIGAGVGGVDLGATGTVIISSSSKG